MQFVALNHACKDFFHPKIPKALVGCVPANLGTKGQ